MTYKNYDFNGTSGMATGLRYWCNFQRNNYWLANRLAVLVQVTAQITGPEALWLYCAPIGWVEYTIDENKYCIIDLTDIVRTYQGELVTIGWGQSPFPQEDEAVIINTTAQGLITPAGVLIPEREDADICKISAPSVMLAPFGSLQLAFEMWSRPEDSYYFATERIKEKPSNNVQNAARSVTLANNTDRVEFWHLQEEMYRAVDIQPLSCEHTYACVEWVSFTGQTRRHVFEIAKAEIETGDVIKLENILNEWSEIKGRVDCFALRLENLDRYDLWYYSDLITSSRVRITLDGVNWYNVQVDEKKYKLPESNAGKLSTLEIDVKFRKYDAVDL